MTNGFGGIEPLGTYSNAVHDAATSEHTERIFKLRQPFFGISVSAVSKEAVCLKQACRPNKLIRIPPE